MRYVDFDNWWGDILKNRTNKVIDIKTRRSMVLSKRKTVERATTADLLNYLAERDPSKSIHITYYNNMWYITLLDNKESLVALSDKNLSTLVENTVLSYLKSRYDNPEV